jgi:hypothetical protein
LIELFQKQANALVKPELWDDPFENLVFHHKASLQNGMIASFDNLRNSLYGQCWTLNQNETDALWRIYSPKKDGVRVTTTLGKLFDSFYNPQNNFAMVSYFIGKMLYDTASNLKQYFEDPDTLASHVFDSSAQGHVETLLVKRIEFQHENEVSYLKINYKNPHIILC